MNDIKCLKLISGEEIVSKVKELDDNILELTNPVQIGLAGGGQLAMAPFMPFVNDNSNKVIISINKSHVMVLANPIADLVNTYNSKFGSGLVVPESNVLANSNLKLID